MPASTPTTRRPPPGRPGRLPPENWTIPPSAPTGGAGGAIVDGRDIGTQVCPHAQVKLFVTASLETRAERRLKQLQAEGQTSIKARVLHDMRERDARDSARALSPLKQAQDAHLVDTTSLNADQAFETARALIEAHRPKD